MMKLVVISGNQESASEVNCVAAIRGKKCLKKASRMLRNTLEKMADHNNYGLKGPLLVVIYIQIRTR